MIMATDVLAQNADQCKGITCSKHGKCAVKNGMPVCVCDEGYKPEANGLGCKTEPPNTKKIDFQFGMGFNLGFLPGIKLRQAFTFGENHRAKGLLLGLDGDLNTVVSVTTATLSAIIGWRFSKWFRLYATLGGGIFYIPCLGGDCYPEDIYSEDGIGAIGHFGAGMEWTFRTWFGLGFEAGVNTDFYENPSFWGGGWEGIIQPYAALTLMFYIG
jgi:hypothetical protein